MGFRLFVFVDVNGTGLTVDSLELNIRLQIGFLHLKGYQTAGHRHGADVMARICLNSDDVSFVKV